ncbi:helix-turn-helix transcriptional regulator [Dyadobacter sp. CY312]|uniref:helix-turn-helix domain-containing protein n=1 Tax=Dyadobacter sp. CY312 TaxID=2907303 RepID=UPI001F3783DE|nr:helix-turn-helix transcriptional regulator [Dyadobacter sp. CY312]MCE7038972.1 helix-turn-helix transcriptional regulator [Dyadobacter sp. CY312]
MLVKTITCLYLFLNLVSNMSDIASRLALIMEQRKITPYALAKHLPISQPTIGRILKGVSIPSKTTISLISQHLGVNEAWLVSGEGSVNRDDAPKQEDPIQVRVRSIIEYLNITPKEFAKKLGYKKVQTIQDFLNGKTKLNFDLLDRIDRSEFSGIIDLTWLITGQGSMLFKDKIDLYGSHLEAVNFDNLDPSVVKESLLGIYENFRKYRELNTLKTLLHEESLGEKNDVINSLNSASTNLKIIRSEELTEIRDLGQGRTLLVTPFISHEANQAYIQGLNDPEFLNSLPRHAVSMHSISFDVYRSFEMNLDPYTKDGNSPVDLVMEQGTIFTGRRIQQISRRHLEFNQLYVLVLVERIVIARAKKYDAANHIMEYRTLETDSEVYQIDLQKTLEIFVVVATTQY